MNVPYLINFSSIGTDSIGFLTVAQSPEVPFTIKRAYWTYNTPSNQIRGFHAHRELHQLIFSITGEIEFYTEDIFGNKNIFKLDQPNIGLYIPPMVWREIKFGINSTLLCLASFEYFETDYIRNYEDFKKLIKKND